MQIIIVNRPVLAQVHQFCAFEKFETELPATIQEVIKVAILEDIISIPEANMLINMSLETLTLFLSTFPTVVTITDPSLKMFFETLCFLILLHEIHGK